MKRIIDIDEEEHNRIRHFCSFSDNNIPLGWYEIAKSKPLKAELEEIKAEIDNIRDVEVTDGNIYVNEDNVFEILDNHISELKGENK